MRRAAWRQIYIGVHLAAGAAVICATAATWQLHDRRQFFAYLLAAVVASCLKVRFPGVEGTASVGFLFVFIGILDLSTEDAVVIAAISLVAQSLWRTEQRPQPVQICWSVASISLWTYACGALYGWSRLFLPEPAALAALGAVFFAGTTLSLAGVIALDEGKRLGAMMKVYAWLLPYYLCGTSVAWIIGTMPRAIQWEVPIICLPVIYLIHHSYARHLAQMQQEKKHAEEMNGLHLRTIETLAVAIDARDHETHEHLSRVQVYALGIAEELGLDRTELNALRAASLLHDIGKLAVPEQILSKPGRLTEEEFGRMKTHPVVGAEILECVGFPYPVVPIVRAHHERWNGGGYPYGLRGEQIPIGARILAAVDCLDALASDRQYRRALPLDEAMARIASEAGTSFDPKVIAVLERRYHDLEARAREASRTGHPVLSRNARIECGAPAAGYARASAALARLALHTAAGGVRSEALEPLDARLRQAVPHDAMAFFVERGGILRADYAAGTAAGMLSLLAVPSGAGLVGWVAAYGAPIINGNPAVEPGWPAMENDALQSALVLPFTPEGGQPGVLSLYRVGAEAFDAADLEALQACAAVEAA